MSKYSEYRAQALAQHTGDDVTEIEKCPFQEHCYITANGDEYLVLSDAEADDRWDNELEDYIDQCILPELHSQWHNYFDRERWKRDARFDGRGHSLAHYDGEEHEETVEVNETACQDFYLYQIN